MILLGLSESVERKKLNSFSSYWIEEGFIQFVGDLLLKLRAETPLVQQDTQSANTRAEYEDTQCQQRFHLHNSKKGGQITKDGFTC